MTSRRLNTRRGPIPSELGGLLDDLSDHRERIDELESLDASTANSAVGRLRRLIDHLASLTTDVVVGGNRTVSQPNNGAFTWYATSAPDLKVDALPVSTGLIMVTVTVGECRLAPSGGNVQGLVGYSVVDSNGVTVPNGALATAQRYGRVQTAAALFTGLRTPEIPLQIDPVANPGPYTIRGFVGAYVQATNAGACNFTFNDISMRVDVLDVS